MSGKMWAFHGEADKPGELLKLLEAQAAELRALVGGGNGNGAAAPTKAAAAAKGSPGATLEEVQKGLRALKEAHDANEDEPKDGGKKKSGLKQVMAVLKKFGVKQSPDLKEEQYGSCLEAIKAAMPKEEEGTSEFD